MKKILTSLFVLVSLLHCNDECTFFGFGSSDFSTTLNTVNNLYVNADSAGSNGSPFIGNTDTYHINTTEAGTVSISLTGNQMNFSYGLSNCPAKGDTPDSNGPEVYTFPVGADTDFNLRVYRNNGSSQNYTLSMTFTPSAPPCTALEVDDDKVQCPSACYTTIQDAVDAAAVNDTITICPGTYTEAIQIIGKSGLSLISSTTQASDVIIDSGTGNNNAFYLNNSPSTKFDSLSIQANQNAIQFFNNPGSFEIKDSILSSQNDHTVFVNGTPANIKITGNDFIGAGNGFKSALQFQGGITTGEITDNNISIGNNNGYGIFIQSAPTNLSVTRNCFDQIGSEEAYSFATGGSPLFWDGNYWEKQAWFGVIDNTPLTSCLLGGTPSNTPVVDYRFDECYWDGTPAEVKDSTLNSFDGIAVNGATTVNESQIERSGYFDGVNDYVEQDDFYDTLKTTASLSFWIKTTQVSAFGNAQRSPGVTGIEDNGGVDDIFWGWIDNTGRISIQKGNNLGPKSLNPINDDIWHHIVLTRDKDSQVCKVYVDGVLNDTDTSAPGIVGNSFNRIGSVMDTDGTHTYFNGHLDEVKAYASVLTDIQVQDIYTNESAGNNYDGSARAPINCTSGLLAEYRLDECVWDGATDEVLDNSGNAYHGRSRNGASVEAATVSGGGICTGGKFDGDNDYVEIQNFPDVLDDFSITAWFKTERRQEAGQRIFADDESSGNGYAISVGDGGTGRVRFYDRSQSNAGIIDTANIVQNDTWYFVTAVNDKSNGLRHLYVYDVGGSQLAHETRAIDANRGSNTGLASIGGETDSGEVNNRFLGNIDEVKIFTKALSAVELEDIRNNESLGVNWDGTSRTCPDCSGAIPKDGNFTAVDFVGVGCNALSHWNDNLQTKVVNDSIDLSILALDKTTNLPLEANITKVSLVHYPSGNNNACSGPVLSSIDVCTNCGLTDVEGCLSLSISNSFNQRASRCVEILIQGKDKDDLTGIFLNDSNSSDNLAIRPDTYSCDGITAGVLVAEHNYTSSFEARPLNLSIPTLGYTTSSVNLSAQKYTRAGDLNSSLNGAVSPSMINFIDGNASVDLSFNDVGDVGIDLNDSAWADVDSDDTAELDRVVHAECRRLFRADHFSIVLARPRLENNASSGFTYLSNLTPSVRMSAWMKNLSFVVTAQGENNATMLNYKDPSSVFYANLLTLSPLVTFPTKHSAATKQVDLIDANSSDLTGFLFVDGVASYVYEDLGFNYNRAYDGPINPFSVDGNESYFRVGAQDRLYPSVVGEAITDSDDNVSFYYGRLRPSDLITTFLPATNSIFYEVYDSSGSSYTQGMKQSSVYWFINNLHNDTNEGNITLATASSNTLIDNALGGYSYSYYPISLGNQNLGINTASSSTATIHLHTQEWLWYAPSGFGLPYDDTSGSDCSSHPCFKFSMLPTNNALKVESGDFNGTVVPDENRSDYIKKGVKLFR